jgi:hypothetical protein
MTAKKSIKNQISSGAVVPASEISSGAVVGGAVVAPVVGGTLAVAGPVVVNRSISLDMMSLLTAPKQKVLKEIQKIKVEKKTLKSLEDQFLDFAGCGLSVFGALVSLHDIKGFCRLSSDFDLAYSQAISKNGIGSVDSDDNFSGKIIFQGAITNLTDFQVFAYSKAYSEDKNDKTHAGLYSWQVQKFLKTLLIAQAVKSKKSLEIHAPVSCAFISLSWSSFAECLISLGCEKMAQNKIDHLKSKYDHSLIETLNQSGLLLDIEIQSLFDAVLNAAVVAPAQSIDESSK